MIEGPKTLQVKQFMKRLPACFDELSGPQSIKAETTLNTSAMLMHLLADRLRELGDGDQTCKRAFLVVQESAELLEALADGDEREALDALCDLLYVTYGAAVQFCLPIDEAFEEVHRSNMTKNPRTIWKKARGKDKTYQAPDLAPILHATRKEDMLF